MARGCEWTLRALQTEAAAAARRGVPPSWLALGLERRETLVNQNWNRACASLAANQRGYLVRAGKFVGAGDFPEKAAAARARAAKAKADTEAAAAARENTHAPTGAASDSGTRTAAAAFAAEAVDGRRPPRPSPPPFPKAPKGTLPEGTLPEGTPEAPPPAPDPAETGQEGRSDPADAGTGFNVTRGVVSVCALLRLDAASHAHLLGTVAAAGIHPFSAGEAREACALVTGTSACRGANHAADLAGGEGDVGGGAGSARRRSEL